MGGMEMDTPADRKLSSHQGCETYKYIRKNVIKNFLLVSQREL